MKNKYPLKSFTQSLKLKLNFPIEQIALADGKITAAKVLFDPELVEGEFTGNQKDDFAFRVAIWELGALLAPPFWASKMVAKKLLAEVFRPLF